MGNKNQSKGNNKSLLKETFRKAIGGEGHGAVAGNASAKNLNRNGSERLNRFALTQSYSAAKLQQNTETTKKGGRNDVFRKNKKRSGIFQDALPFNMKPVTIPEHRRQSVDGFSL
jgi:hypothetical protein